MLVKKDYVLPPKKELMYTKNKLIFNSSYVDYLPKYINRTEFKIICVLTNYKEITKRYEIKENNAFNKKPHEKNMASTKESKSKYNIEQNYKREDGWMDGESLALAAGVNANAIYTKINRLVENGYVDREELIKVHRKEKNNPRKRLVFRLNVNIKTLKFLWYLIMDLAAEFSRKRLELEDIKGAETSLIHDDLIKFLKSDYVASIPKETKVIWANDMALIAEGEKLMALCKIALLEKIIKQDGGVVRDRSWIKVNC